MKGEVILLNALVMPSKSAVIFAHPISVEEARKIVYRERAEGKEIKSFIGHPATAEILGNALELEIPVNRGEYTPTTGDTVIVARLARRLEKPGDVDNITSEDLKLYEVVYRFT